MPTTLLLAPTRFAELPKALTIELKRARKLFLSTPVRAGGRSENPGGGVNYQCGGHNLHSLGWYKVK